MIRKTWGWMVLGWLVSSAVMGEEGGIVQVRTQLLKHAAMPFVVNAYGTLTVSPVHLHSVSFPRAGQVEHWRVTVGQSVKAGMPLFDFLTDPTASNLYDQAQSTLLLARHEDQRMQRQFDQHLVTASQREMAHKVLVDAESAFLAQQHLGSEASKVTFLAPRDGVIWAENAAQGDRLTMGGTVMQWADSTRPDVEITLPVEQAALWRLGTTVTVQPLWGPTHLWHAKMETSGGLINAQTQGIEAWLSLMPGEGQRMGQKVRVTLTQQVRSLWAVPRLAVLHDEAGDYVFQVADQRAHRVTVRAWENGDVTGIEGSLHEAWPVVVEGNYELSDGMRVREATP